MQIKVHNNTAHHILKNEVDLILPNFPKDERAKEEFLVQLFQCFIGLTFKGISKIFI